MWIAYFYDSINKSVSSGVWLIALQNQTSLPVVNTTILKKCDSSKLQDHDVEWFIIAIIFFKFKIGKLRCQVIDSSAITKWAWK